jgi:hypothetical protein
MTHDAEVEIGTAHQRSSAVLPELLLGIILCLTASRYKDSPYIALLDLVHCYMISGFLHTS